MHALRAGGAVVRAFASLVLAGFLVSAVTPPVHAAAGDPMGCTDHHPVSAEPALDAAAPGGGCDTPTACPSMPGCATPAPAIAAPLAPRLPLAGPLVAAPPQPTPLIGRAAFAPPTPPPNS